MCFQKGEVPRTAQFCWRNALFRANSPLTRATLAHVCAQSSQFSYRYVAGPGLHREPPRSAVSAAGKLRAVECRAWGVRWEPFQCRGISMTRRALVTGASRGIGASIAVGLAEAGHDVIVHYVARKTDAESVAERVRALGRNAELSCFDVRDHTQARAEIEVLMARGAIDVLVNNAGVVADNPFPAVPKEAWDRVILTSLDGFYNVTQPLIMPMVRRRFGRVINIASISGVMGNRGQVNYSAAKAGLIGATKALAREVAKRGITVNALAPGLIDTEMIEGAHVEEILKHIPMGRVGKPEEVSALAVFLASDIAAYITGQVIGIAGGLG
jgi:3-oxoacyl-[acyl-carrier protein] reductase